MLFLLPYPPLPPPPPSSSSCSSSIRTVLLRLRPLAWHLPELRSRCRSICRAARGGTSRGRMRRRRNEDKEAAEE
eukprot:5890265-Pyramimonas_sp.AAC.1